MRIKGAFVEHGEIEDDDGDLTDRAAAAATKKLRKAIKLAVDDMEIEIHEEIKTLVDKYMMRWLRTMMSEQGYIAITPRAGTIEAYVSIPMGTDSDGDPAWRFDLGEALNDLFEMEQGGAVPLTPKERTATIKTRDAFQRLVDLYNRDLETR